MFSCCILPYHVYGPQTTRSQNLCTRFKGWLTSHTPHLWPFARRSSKVFPQEFGKDKTDQSFLSLTIQEGMMRHPADTSQRWAWALDTSTVDKRSFPRLWTVHNTPLERLVAHLVPAFLLCDTTFIHSFLSTYTDVATTQEVLDEFFNSYRFILYCRVDDAPTRLWKKALAFILRMWMESYPQDFCQPPHFPSLRRVLAFLAFSMPGSQVERQARLLLSQLLHPEPSEAESQAPAPEKDPNPDEYRPPAPTLVPTTPQSHRSTSSTGAASSLSPDGTSSDGKTIHVLPATSLSPWTVAPPLMSPPSPLPPVH
ncbi:ral guanine nucleotide dissociation stimulator-like isoform X1 [Equus caballus]|uniref:ral guanine nucleotide dissociation stimulator-like isoform X1 n=1 Tax=Equus caballus TaxID=9796 RepID=UPI0003ACC2F6|nr:ral guanine nucleotide dissociation stimulator-like isoform X1 [Equus caballus]